MKSGKLRWVALATVTVAMFAGPAQASEPEFKVFDGTRTSPVLIDAGYGGAHDDRDYRQLRRAVQDLRQDVAMVTGAIDGDQVRRLFVDDEPAQAARLAGADQSKVPALITQPGERASAIIVGEIGESDLVDGIIAAGKFNEAAQLEGKWEAHAVKQIANPLPGIDSALVIAGSDARGTIYGIYSVSERIGVSPWYWYSDVPIERRATITLDGAVRVDTGPDVKYRGIFINDEERTIDWAKLKFPTVKGTPDVNYYRHVYELMLRLKLNTLWPAMHEGTTSFNAATDTGLYDAGTPINAKEAAAYGVVASSSHAELMLRSNVEEWRPFYERNRVALNIQGANYTAAFNYSINKPAIIQYWRERLLANREFESILALGMRGVHDGAPAFTANNPYGFANTVQMVGDAITEQRKLIAEIYGSTDAVPQVFVPYKEMADLYNAGLKAYIPGDVTLMWAEDNAGYLRQVPTRAEAARAGGNGIYYHSSYWGSPKSYLWLNSAPMALMVEQLQRAYSSDAGRFWILNVGDLKPGEMKTELFAKLAWDVDGYDDSNIKSRFLVEQLQRDFGLGASAAAEAADALDRFSTLENTKRAEYWGTQNPAGVHSAAFNAAYSFPLSPTADGDELQRYLDEANALVAILDDVSARLGERYRSAFYQQVLHRVRSYRNQAEQLGYYWKNQLAAEQRRHGSATIYAALSKAARERIKTDEAYFHALEGGKWNGAIGYSHPITYYGGVNEGIVMLTDDRYAVVTSASDGVGASAEGQRTPGAGTLRFNSASPQDERFFDVFNRNDVAEDWIAEADASWLTLSAGSGRTSTEQRVAVKVDWSRLDAGATGTIRVYSAVDGVKSGTAVATFTVRADKSTVDLAGTRGHAEANGYVAIEAEHFAENLPGADGTRWGLVTRNAQRGDTMKAYPETAARVDADFGSTARLKYRVHFTSSGQFTGTFYRVPTLNEGTDDSGTARSTRIAIGLGETPPVSATLRGCAQTSCGSAWANNVMRQIEPLTFTINVPAPGWHDLVVYRSDAAIVFDRIIIPTVAGAVADGLVGPPESPNSIPGAAAQIAKVASLPKLITTARALPAVSLSVGQTAAVEGLDDAATVSSSNATIVSVALDQGRVQLTGGRAGTAAITVVGRDGAFTSLTVTVIKGDAPPLGSYQERDGLVVIDAADALERSAFADAIDSNNTTHTWAQTRNGLQTVPVASGSAQHWLATSAAQGQALLAATPTQKVNGSAAAGTPPRLEFTVDIANGGTYYLFANTSNPNATADSYHVAVDGQWKYHSSKGGEELGAETWYGSTGVAGAALTLEPGAHRIALWTRESGLLVNQLALTKSTTPGLTGLQPPSARKRLTPLVTTHALTPAAADGQNGWYTSNPTLMLTSEPGASTQYKLGSGAFAPYLGPITIEQSGTTVVSYRSTDAVGNVEAEKALTVKLDKTAPVTSATVSGAPDAEGWRSHPVTVTLTGTDSDSGVAHTQYAIDGGEWRTYDQPFAAGAGEHTIRYRSTDHAGLTENAGQLTVKSRVQSTHPGAVGGSVAGTLALSLGAPASFAAFVPGTDREYTAATTANVVSTAGDAQLTLGDPGHLTNGAFTLSEPLRVELSTASWTAPVSNDLVTITFRQHIGSTQPLRTGTYGGTVMFTLSTTSP